MRVSKVGKDQYVARVGDFFGVVSPTPQAAIVALDAALENYHPLTHVYLRTKDCTLIHIWQVPSHNWNYKVIRPDGTEQGVGVYGTLAEAKARAVEHAAQFGGLA